MSNLKDVLLAQIKFMPGKRRALASNSNRSALENLDRNIKLSTVFCLDLMFHPSKKTRGNLFVYQERTRVIGIYQECQSAFLDDNHILPSQYIFTRKTEFSFPV